MKLSETIQEVIVLAEKIEAYWETELPKRHPDYPLVNPGEDSGPPPPELKTLEDLLNTLPEEELYTLYLVRKIGQGVVSLDSLPEAYTNAKDYLGEPQRAVRFLLNAGYLALDLSDGVSSLEEKQYDIDALPLTVVC